MIRNEAVNFGAGYVLINKYFLQQILRDFKKAKTSSHKGLYRAQLFFLFSLLASDNGLIHFHKGDPTFIHADFLNIPKKYRGYDRNLADSWFIHQRFVQADDEYDENAYFFNPIMDGVKIEGDKNRSHDDSNDNLFSAIIEKGIFERFYSESEKKAIRAGDINDPISVYHYKQWEAACKLLKENPDETLSAKISIGQSLEGSVGPVCERARNFFTEDTPIESAMNLMGTVIQYGKYVLVSKDLFGYFRDSAYNQSTERNLKKMYNSINLDYEEPELFNGQKIDGLNLLP